MLSFEVNIYIYVFVLTFKDILYSYRLKLNLKITLKAINFYF